MVSECVCVCVFLRFNGWVRLCGCRQSAAWSAGDGRKTFNIQYSGQSSSLRAENGYRTEQHLPHPEKNRVGKHILIDTIYFILHYASILQFKVCTE